MLGRKPVKSKDFKVKANPFFHSFPFFFQIQPQLIKVINTNQAYGINCDSQPSHVNGKMYTGFSKFKVRVCILYKLSENKFHCIHHAYSQRFSVTWRVWIYKDNYKVIYRHFYYLWLVLSALAYHIGYCSVLYLVWGHIYYRFPKSISSHNTYPTLYKNSIQMVVHDMVHELFIKPYIFLQEEIGVPIREVVGILRNMFYSVCQRNRYVNQ